MVVRPVIERLAGHISGATVRGPVRAYVAQLGAPFLLGEIWRPLGLPRQVVRRELNRMVKKGLLLRHQIMAPRYCYFPQKQEKLAMQYLYTPVELGE